MQPSWQLMQGRMRSSLFVRIFFTMSGSARSGRPREMMSQVPSSRQASAVSGLSTRPAMRTGTLTCSFTIFANFRYGAFSMYIGGWFHHQAS